MKKDIFELTELDKVSDEEKNEIFQKAYETVVNRVMLRIAELLPEQDLEELTKLIEEESADSVHTFLEQKGIEIDQIATAEAMAYKIELASITKALHGNNQEEN